MLETLPLTDWTGPYDAAVKARAVAALERGAVLFFPGLAFALADSEKQFLDARVSRRQGQEYLAGSQQRQTAGHLPDRRARPTAWRR